MRNVVTVQLRAFQDYDISGCKSGKTAYGFYVFDECEEKTYMDFTQNEFKKFINNPQEVLDYVMEFFEMEFKYVVLNSGGFYISNTWYEVDSLMRIRNVA